MPIGCSRRISRGSNCSEDYIGRDCRQREEGTISGKRKVKTARLTHPRTYRWDVTSNSRTTSRSLNRVQMFPRTQLRALSSA